MTIRRSPRPELLSFSEWPISAKVAAVTIGLTLVLFVTLIIIAGQIIHQGLYAEALDNMEQTTQLEALEVVDHLDRAVAALQVLSANPSIQQSADQAETSGDIAVKLKSAREQSEGMRAIALVSNDKKVVAVSPAPESDSNPDISKWIWFDEAQTNAYIGGLDDDGLTRISGIQIAVPINDPVSSERVGVLLAIYDPNSFSEGLDVEGPFTVNVYSNNGEPLIGSVFDPPPLPNDISQHIQSGPSGVVAITSGPQLPQVYGFTRLSNLEIKDSPAGNLEWIVTVQRAYLPLEEQLWAKVAAVQRLIAIGAVILCLGIIAINSILFRPAVRLTSSAEQIIESDEPTTSIPVPNEYDLRILSSALQTLLGRLNYRATQLDTAAAIFRDSITYDIHTLLDRTARLIYEHLGFPAIYIYRMESDGLRAQVEVAYGTPDTLALKPGASLILSEQNIVGRALLRNETQWNKGLEAAFRGKEDEPAEVVIPFRGTISGALHILGNGPNVFSQIDVNIFQLIASEINVILDNHELIEQAHSAREQAELANQLKSQFLAAMSHELRTPLNSIINFSMFVAQKTVGPINEKQEELLNMVIDSSEHLLSLINDVLDISKIESGMLDLLIDEDVNVNKILEGVVTTGKGLLGDKPVEIILDAGNLPLIVADQRRVRQIILNVVSNACKFTSEGSITIKAWQAKDDLQIMIKDTGPGIAPEDHEAVFETFRQTDVGLAHGTGTGLGMPISKRLTEAHGGQLWLESAVGEGSTFYITLPIHSEILAEKAYKKLA